MLGDSCSHNESEGGDEVQTPSYSEKSPALKKRKYLCIFCNRSHHRHFRTGRPYSRSTESLEKLFDNGMCPINKSASELCTKCNTRCSNVLKQLKATASLTATKSNYKLAAPIMYTQRASRGSGAATLQPSSPGKHGRDGTMILSDVNTFIAGTISKSQCPKCKQQLQNAAPIRIHGKHATVTLSCRTKGM